MAPFEGAIFDVDGVLVDSPHEKAWREALRELMEGDWSDIRAQTTWTPDGYTPQVYQELVSGKPRMAGARAALEHFDVPGLEERVVIYADRKQEMILRLIDAQDFTAYPDALRFIIAAKEAGVAIAAASSSKNAEAFLSRVPLAEFAERDGIPAPTLTAGMSLFDYLDADVSGREFAHGKPHPDMFLAAAEELGVAPERAMVLEDAAAGIQAARAGGMAAIGIARFDDADLLVAAGADLVVTSLDEIDRSALSEGRLAVGGDG